MLPDPRPRDGEGDGPFIEFERNLSGLKSHYRDTSITISSLTEALELAYEYGADSPRAYAKKILEGK